MRVLLIGQDDRAEMRPIVEWLAERTSAEELCRCRSIAEALNSQFSRRVDLIVVLESHPDEFSAAEALSLFAAAPVSRIVCCAGVWSESAGRTRKIWPLAVRVAAVNAIARLEQEWKLLSGENGDFRLPLTASREEWFATHHPAVSLKSTRLELSVRVESPDAAYRQMLVALLALHGLKVAGSETMSPEVILWDADPWNKCREEELQRLAQAGPVIALSGWVTTDLQQELQRVGAQTVVPKLGDQMQLLECIWSVALSAAQP